MQKQAEDRTVLGFNNSDCNSSKENIQSCLDKGRSNTIHFVRSSTIYKHDDPDIQPSLTVTRENKGKHKRLGYVELESSKSNQTLLKCIEVCGEEPYLLSHSFYLQLLSKNSLCEPYLLPHPTQ